MIKSINDGELKRLKEGFYYTLALKKIALLDSDKFMRNDEGVTLNQAISLYKLISYLKFPEDFSKCSSIMMDYLFKYNLYNEYDLNGIKSIFYDDSDIDIDEYEQEFFDNYYYLNDRKQYILELLKKLAAENGKVVHCSTYTEIIFEDIDDNIFGNMRITLRDYMGNYSDDMYVYNEDELEDEYVNIFQDDAIVYAIEGLELNYFQLSILSKSFTGSDSGVSSEVYCENGNTYIVISFCQLTYGIGYSFLILLKLIFIDI
ncbi:hypothetical protein FDB39_17340 [Clostridium botulinum]|nr:hypothetical protein [Clostridium botulinum]